MENSAENAGMDYGNMFTVMPMNQRFLLEPGQTYEGSVTVVNPADAKTDFSYKVEVTPYSVLGAEYAADLATMTNQSKIVDWITLDRDKGTIAPNGFEKINFTITVPEDAAGGGQYATIAVSSDMENETEGSVAVNNIFEMASIIYGQVSGEINHVGAIQENHIPAYAATSPITVTAKLTNEGNVHEDATIVLKATNFFTGEVILPTEGNEARYTELVMPGTDRYVQREIDNLPFLGVVHVEQTVYYMGTSSVEMVNVVICPIWFLLLVILTFCAIVFAIVRIIIRHRKKKARLVV